MIVDTCAAIKKSLEGISDGSNKSPRITWTHPSEHKGDQESRVPVSDRTQTQVVLSIISSLVDRERASVKQNIGKFVYVDGELRERRQKFPEPIKLMIQIDAFVEGDNAHRRLIRIDNEIANRLRDRSYLEVETDVFGDGFLTKMQCLVVLESNPYTLPPEKGRTEYRVVRRYSINTWRLDRENITDVPILSEVEVKITAESTQGNVTEEVTVT